ncbi:hypothetical protein [Belliella aquatica]|uniref:TonB-dependent receptor n=1 Tax=Belliella aquatica TaxID=1323734 RepID=A0ABQ1N985_9BACT|nr:hypothetical protein [Belliella aquatica]MCH7407607.1 hypothetical protein [Belliella aquatica]GGC55098.1 hypothetical protein GCM10010993_36800 [Belliella aquatica]
MKNYIILALGFMPTLAFSQEVTTTVNSNLPDSTILKQEVTTALKSSLPDSTAYIVNGKFTPTKDLKNIPQDFIKSVSIVKRDTVINKQKYEAQIFILLKTKEEY